MDGDCEKGYLHEKGMNASQLTTQKAVVLRVCFEICFSWGDAVFGVVDVVIPTKARESRLNRAFRQPIWPSSAEAVDES